MKEENLKNCIYLGKGLLLSYIITTILILLFSFLITYSSLEEGKTALLNTIVMIVSIASGSIYLTSKIREKGWISGGILGIGYYLILLIINLIFFKSLGFDMFSITKLGINAITGIIGGIIGINLLS